MEKILAVNIEEKELENIYRICSQMRIMVISVSQEQKMVPLEQLLEGKAYRPGNGGSAGVAGSIGVRGPVGSSGSAQSQDSLIIMCDLCEKHMDKLLAALRLGTTKVTHKAVLTATNRKWNVLRMLAEMEQERRAYESKMKSK